MRYRKAVPIVITLSLLTGACASGSPESGDTPPPPGSGTDPTPRAVEAADPPAVAAGATLAGIYSDEQAARGRGTFRSVCGECHYSREFRDEQFKFSWRRRSLADLFGHISETMPENAPGSLSSRQYADVVAYILSLNGIPAGTEELPTDMSALDAYSLTALSAN